MAFIKMALLTNRRRCSIIFSNGKSHVQKYYGKLAGGRELQKFLPEVPPKFAEHEIERHIWWIIGGVHKI